MTQVALFPNETDSNVPKWESHNYSQVRLELLFQSETDTIAFEWYGTIVFK